MGYNEWLDIDVLEDYLEGKLDPKTMHLVEKISLEDPFVAEALAGLSRSPRRTHQLSILQKQLQDRIAQKPIVQKRWRITSQRLSIGAAAAVLFVTVSILFWMKESNNRELAGKKSKNVVVQVAPQVAKESNHVSDTTPVVNLPIPPAGTGSAVRTKEETRNESKSKAKTFIPKAPVAIEEQTVVAAIKDDDATKATNNEARAAVSSIILGDKNKASRAETPPTVALKGKVAGIRVESGINGSQHGVIINGRVYAKEDGLPLSGAVVKLAGTNKATTTDTKGEFKLAADSSNTQSLSIAYVGYTTQQVNAQTNQPVNVALETSANQLNEVVLVEMADDLKKTANTPAKLNHIGSMSSNAMPVGGWERFDAYLKANNKLLKSGSTAKYVTLSFEIRKDGRARNIKVVNGLGGAEDQEAIRLIEEGPSWTAKSADRNTKLSIKF